MTARQRIALFLLALVVICNWIFVFLALLMVPICGAVAESDLAVLFMGWAALLAVAGTVASAGILGADKFPDMIWPAYVAVFFLIFSACCNWYSTFTISGSRVPPVDAIVMGTLAIADLLTLTLNRPLPPSSPTRD